MDNLSLHTWQFSPAFHHLVSPRASYLFDVCSLCSCCRILTKLGRGESSEVTEKEQEGTLRTLCITNSLRDAGEKTHKVHISIKASRGPLSEDGLSKMEEAQELQCTGALLMLLHALPAPSPGSEDVPLLSALLQLKQLQQANIWDCPLPLAILVPGSHDTQKLEEELKTLVHFVEACLCHDFSVRLYHHRQDRAGAGLACQHLVCANTITLYNTVLAFLADLVSSQQLSSLSWPPGEFALPETPDVVPHLAWTLP
ncbi:hypothetical protein J4Q44_G00200660 [Coregonus suidteri]|uniref:Germinal-centre associated nuclear protein MCM3AP domain-containing protein n=1 Tax=Coregonus suidteri TaxID=861788 RepID=A0AAN8LFQ9_9TELE